jgi:orotidine-5'-phosphate decarboxylase
MQSSSTIRSAKDRLILALDVPTLDEARKLAELLGEHVGMLKFGLELYARHGVELFTVLEQYGRPLFFDCKFMDIPNTVARASRQLVGRNIEIFNVHATGGGAMMKATRDAVHEEARAKKVSPPKIIAVTILTSLSDAALKDELGWNVPVDETVERLAKLTKECGLDGVVASAKESKRIRKACGDQFLIITPGVRPEWASPDDQARAVTPAEAIAGGADYIVVGRPITQQKDPVDAARRIVDEVASQL